MSIIKDSLCVALALCALTVLCALGSCNQPRVVDGTDLCETCAGQISCGPCVLTPDAGAVCLCCGGDGGVLELTIPQEDLVYCQTP